MLGKVPVNNSKFQPIMCSNMCGLYLTHSVLRFYKNSKMFMPIIKFYVTVQYNSNNNIATTKEKKSLVF